MLLNQAELAAKIGIETKYLSNLETGRRSPSFEKTVALAKALDVPMSALFSFDQDEADPKTLKRRIEAILTKATAQQLRQIYGHVRQVMES
jgi:transcriptional regulator with XRE-family HTH domain